MRKSPMLIVILSLMAQTSLAAETDNFTHRYEPLEDSLPHLNNVTNRWLREALLEANSEGQCNVDELYDEVLDRFVGEHVNSRGFGNFEMHVKESGEYALLSIDRDDSIYQDADFTDSFGPFFVGLAPSLRIGDHHVGVDKIGHFFSEGHIYFDIAYLEGNGVDAAVDWGIETEEGYWGLSTAGVYSYGDLVANFNGMRFWRRLLGDYDADNAPPYVVCSSGRWEQNATIDWRDFVSAGWDESINCSAFLNEDLRDDVFDIIEDLEDDHGYRFTCPIVPERCVDLMTSAELAGQQRDLISPACRAASRALTSGETNWWPPEDGDDYLVHPHADYLDASLWPLVSSCQNHQQVLPGWLAALLVALLALKLRHARPRV